jgi:hypothetical protein
MKIRILWSGLAASAVMLVAGAAFSGGPAVDNRLFSFDPPTGHLTGLPLVTGGTLTTYLHDHSTLHVTADLTKFLPPDPCGPIARIWNDTVRYDTRHDVTSTYVFELLLTIMSDLQCRASVTSVAGTPAPITVIAPSAD